MTGPGQWIKNNKNGTVDRKLHLFLLALMKPYFQLEHLKHEIIPHDHAWRAMVMP